MLINVTVSPFFSLFFFRVLSVCLEVYCKGEGNDYLIHVAIIRVIEVFEIGRYEGAPGGGGCHIFDAQVFNLWGGGGREG